MEGVKVLSIATGGRFTAQIMKAARRGDRERIDEIVENIWRAGRKQGMYDLALDLWDGDEVGESTVEFMMDNNGVADPRVHATK